jgi:hypothetical protein
MAEGAGRGKPAPDDAVEVENWQMVKIKLSDDQVNAIKKATGEDLTHLRVVVEDIADLGDLVAN